jgi:hypothetical protein
MSILVLNADMQPLNVTTFQRGFNLVYKGKAEVVECDSDQPINSTVGKFKRPLVIRLLRFVYIPFKKIPLSRQNIYRRDGHKCGYCESKSQLTLDHVMPKSKGGANSWENLVTCCRKCNCKKDDRTPKQAGMKLLVDLYRPTFQQFAAGINGSKTASWKDYLS